MTRQRYACGVSLARAWREGVGVGDAAWLDESPELALFAALSRLVAGERVAIPAPANGAATSVVHAAAGVLDAVLVRDAALVDRGVAVLGLALDQLPDDDPHAIAARAWADLALGEVATFVGDLRVAHRRFDTIAAVARCPVALRIAAMLRLVGLAMERRDLESARSWARKAMTLAEAKRPADLARAALASGLLAYATHDLAEMRKTLGAIATDSTHGRIARLLIASAEDEVQALTLLADALREAVAGRDTVTYALCVFMGARRYVAMGRYEDARISLDTGILQLVKPAPHLAKLLIEERLACLR